MIRYTPKLDSELWSRKCQRTFDNVEDMKSFIADVGNRFYHYIGEDKSIAPEDVELNASKVVLNDRIVGYCGE